MVPLFFHSMEIEMSSDRKNQPQPGGQDLDLDEHQVDQEMPEDPQDWQDLGPFDDQEQHGGRAGQPGRQGPRARQPR